MVPQSMNTLVEKIVTARDLTFHLTFQRDRESGWFTVHVVELPGCVSQGATTEEARANIGNALEAYLETLLELAIENQGVQGADSVESSAGETATIRVRPKFEVRT